MDRYSLASLTNFAKPLSENCDLAIVVELLRIYKPKSILELGTGNGDWLLFIANALQDPETSLIGYENFSWRQDNTWEHTIASLTELVKSKLEDRELTNTITLKNVNITKLDPIIEYKGKMFDVVRLDCLATDEWQIKKVITDTMPYTHENTIFLVDDIAVNFCPNRYFAMMHLVQEEKLKPLWFGIKEGAWVYPSFDFEKFQLSMKDKLESHWYRGTFYNYPVLGKHRDFLTTVMHHK
jgi:hypothetical protein